MRSGLIILIGLMVGMAVGREMIYPPKHQLFIHQDGQATFVAYKDWKIFSPSKYQVDALITELDHQGALLWMIKGYGDGLYDLRDFAALSKHWKPENIPDPVKPEIFSDDPDPNEPPAPVIPDPEPIITFRISATTAEGGVYHLPSCRYVTETSRTITIEQAQAYRPCKVCRPDELDALLAEFLPKSNLEQAAEKLKEKMNQEIL